MWKWIFSIFWQECWVLKTPSQVKNSFKDPSVLLSHEHWKGQNAALLVERLKHRPQRDPSSYHSGEVDGHEWVRRQEEIIDPQNMPEIWQDVAVPCDQPAEGEDGAHLRTATQRQSIISSNMLPSINAFENMS